MKHQAYLDRAMRASDPRYLRVFEKLGYATRRLTADNGAASVDDDCPELTGLRAQYQQTVGKKAYHGWTANELREKIAAVSGGGPVS